MFELETIEEDEWLAWLAQGASLITVNRRLTRDLSQRYEQFQLSTGSALWHTPTIMPFSTWLEFIWLDHEVSSLDMSQATTLLTPFQSSLVWREIIKAQSESFQSRSDNELTQLAVKAWSLIHEWQIPTRLLQDEANPNVKAFNHWARCYREFCHERNWLDGAELPSNVLTLIRNAHSSDESRRYIFAGFDDFSPRQQALIQALVAAGHDVRVLPFPVVSQQLEVRVYSDTGAELQAVAAWAADILRRNSQASIAIVVPDLSVERERIVKQLEKTLQSTVRLNYGLSPLCFNVTLGRALIEYPIIRSVFIAFDLLKPVFHVNQATAFLLDTYLSMASTEERALIDRKLRDLGEVWLNFDLLMSLVVGCDNNADAAGLVEQLTALAEFRQHRDEFLYPSQWCALLVTLLRRLQWACDLELTSEEYQQYLAWQTIIDQLSQLDWVAGKRNWQATVALLRQLTAETVFQPEANVVPIHVMGLFETAGLSFDHLWVMDMCDETLPAKPNPNPFIPLAVQKKLELPHSTCERELLYAQALVERLAVSASEVVMSYAKLEGESEQRMSPLLKNFPRRDMTAQVVGADETVALIHESVAMVPWSDIATPLAENITTVKGGAGLFKHQAACPFRAFVYFRLSSFAMTEPAIGVNALDRGTLIHAVLENFWAQVKSYQQFILLSDDDLEKKLARLAAQAVSQLAKRKPMTFTPRFRAMECQRLMQRVKDWLMLERQRTPFEVVVVEGKQTIEMAGLSIATKIDRIDKLHDGSLLLIDYKTSEPKVTAWFGERPDEPQLPLYAVASSDKINAIAFAQLKVGAMAFKGLADSEAVPEGIDQYHTSKYATATETWSELLQQWRVHLESLADNFKRGVATVAPKEGNKTCRHCDLASVCRIGVMGEDELSQPDCGEG